MHPHLIASCTQQARQRIPDGVVVVHHVHNRDSRSHTCFPSCGIGYLISSVLESYPLDSLAPIGSRIENVAPRWGLLAAQTLPPWRSTMVRLIASPIPNPSRLV